jgi:hypothetical protein
MEPRGSARHGWVTQPGELSGEGESTLALQIFQHAREASSLRVTERRQRERAAQPLSAKGRTRPVASLPVLVAAATVVGARLGHGNFERIVLNLVLGYLLVWQ